jgi:NAD(P)-dependent dehydrogenase (short-subunit alcohol dehydrogenase family)
METWSVKDKVCMVTGGTSGMGLATCRALASAGADLIVVGRNREKCQRIIKELKETTGNPKINYLLADLSEMKAVRKLSREFHTKYDKLHVLVNNAGGFFLKRELTAEGLEKTFALNHLGHFLLTNLLLDIIKKSAPARIVNVSSWEHFRAKYDNTNLQGEKEYFCWDAYNRSKLYNILFTYELDRRLGGQNITVNTVHPGWVKTAIGKNNGVLAKIALPLMQLKAISVEDGAKPCIYLCTSPDVHGVSGQYYDKMVCAKSSDESCNVENARDLWGISEKLSGLS